ncbi:DUF1329 domain-containing protein, partial [Pseudoxanthomonas broegbernensis]|uniref:DUF1329 domain-containing protein n=1 Tax=Pseudoxanthomonas broegbernensis TaxID=83619 RepID=UPI001391119C
IKGSSFLSIWYYDQRKFPDLYGYFPAFKRVRQFPTNQRFEPLVPGITFFLSDAWAAGDPMLTWGNYKIVERKPFLGAVSNRNWNGADAKWHRPFHGGPKGKTFLDSYFSLVPEAIVLEGKKKSTPTQTVALYTLASILCGCCKTYLSTLTPDHMNKVTYDHWTRLRCALSTL